MLLCHDASILYGIMVDGICGLSRKSDMNDTNTVLGNLKKHGFIENETFSLYITDNQEAYGDNSSMLILGGYDPKYADSDFKIVNVDEDYLFWVVNLTNITFTEVGNENS